MYNLNTINSVLGSELPFNPIVCVKYSLLWACDVEKYILMNLSFAPSHFMTV